MKFGLSVLIVFLLILPIQKVGAWSLADPLIPSFTISDYTGNAQFNYPAGIARDTEGNIYVTDVGNGRVQKFSSSGQYLSQFGEIGSGDGQLSFPTDIAVDSAGKIYVAESGNQRVQVFSSAGTYLYKFGTIGTGDGQFASNVYLDIDSSGNIYAADLGNNRIEKFSNDGTFILKFGTAGTGNGQFNQPIEVRTDSSGNVFITDYSNHRIQKFDSSGNFMLKLGGSGSTNGLLRYPRGIDIDEAGNIYVADYGNGRIQIFDSSGAYVTQFGTSGNGDGQFRSVMDIRLDHAGNLFASEAGSCRVQKLTITGGFILKFGTERFLPGRFYSPMDLTVDSAGNIYVADTLNNRIQKFDSSGNLIFYFGSNGTGNGQFASPYAVAVDSAGNMFVADYSNHRVQKFSSDGTYIKQFGSYGTAPGLFRNPIDIAVDSHDNVYVVDLNNVRIEKFTNNGDYVSMIQGPGGSYGATFSYASGVTLDSSDNIYVADKSTAHVYKFDSNGNLLMAIGGTWGAGNGEFRYCWDVAVDSNGYIYVVEKTNARVQKFDGNGVYQSQFGSLGVKPGQFTGPDGIAVDSAGKIYVADTGNNRVQVFTYDRTAPTGSILINDDAQITNNNTVTLATVAHDTQSSVKDMIVSEFADFTGASWETYAASKSFTLSAGDGTKTVYVKYRDTFNTESSIYSDSIILDTANPTGSITVNNGADITNAKAVVLTINASDELSGVTQMQIAENNLFTGASWETNATNKNWTLSNGDGMKTVYARFKDAAGNISEPVNDTIILDTTAPKAPRITDLGLITNVPDKSPLTYYFTSQTPYIKGKAEAGSTVYFVYGKQTYSTKVDSQGNFAISISSPELPRERVGLSYFAVDVAGNKSSTRMLTLIIGEENFPVKQTVTGESETVPTITPTITPTVTSNIPAPILYIYEVKDQNGNNIENRTVKINEQEYKTDDKGQVKLEAELPSNQVLTVEFEGNKLKASVSNRTINLIVTAKHENKSALSIANLYCIAGIGLVFLVLVMLLLFRRKEEKIK